MTTPGKIFQQIPKIMADVGAIGKDRTNQQQGYAFRGIDDMYNALHAHLSKHCVFVTPKVTHTEIKEQTSQKGALVTAVFLTVDFTFFADDGSSVQVVTVGEGRDHADKASNKAMSAAMKYALLQIFCIPTNEPKDSEIDTVETTPPARTQRPPARTTPPPPRNEQGSAAVPPGPPPCDPDEAGQVIETKIAALGQKKTGTHKPKPGQTVGTPWSLYRFKDAQGNYYSTFSETHFSLVQDAFNEKKAAALTYTVDVKGYRTLTAIVVQE